MVAPPPSGVVEFVETEEELNDGEGELEKISCGELKSLGDGDGLVVVELVFVLVVLLLIGRMAGAAGDGVLVTLVWVLFPLKFGLPLLFTLLLLGMEVEVLLLLFEVGTLLAAEAAGNCS